MDKQRETTTRHFKHLKAIRLVEPTSSASPKLFQTSGSVSQKRKRQDIKEKKGKTAAAEEAESKAKAARRSSERRSPASQLEPPKTMEANSLHDVISPPLVDESINRDQELIVLFVRKVEKEISKAKNCNGILFYYYYAIIYLIM